MSDDASSRGDARLRRFGIAPVTTASDLACVSALFVAYAESLDVDLAYQDFAGEMAAMPGKYAPPAGELLLARAVDLAPVGCVGLRPLGGERCEMKRLYVVPEGRGSGLGAALVEAVIAAAVARGYREMVLDTLPSMHGAQALYGRAGFEPIAPYYESPVAGTKFMRRAL